MAAPKVNYSVQTTMSEMMDAVMHASDEVALLKHLIMNRFG